MAGPNTTHPHLLLGDQPPSPQRTSGAVADEYLRMNRFQSGWHLIFAIIRRWWFLALRVSTIGDKPNSAFGDATQKPAVFSGVGGMLSTALDYARFCQMLLN